MEWALKERDNFRCFVNQTNPQFIPACLHVVVLYQKEKYPRLCRRQMQMCTMLAILKRRSRDPRQGPFNPMASWQIWPFFSLVPPRQPKTATIASERGVLASHLMSSLLSSVASSYRRLGQCNAQGRGEPSHTTFLISSTGWQLSTERLHLKTTQSHRPIIIEALSDRESLYTRYNLWAMTMCPRLSTGAETQSEDNAHAAKRQHLFTL